jgi:hypothetical protein
MLLIGANSVATFLVPDWGDKVNSGIGLSYRPAMLHRLAGRYDNPMPVNYIPQSGTMNFDTGVKVIEVWWRVRAAGPT